MNDSTVRLSADTSALTDSLSKIAEEMTAMKGAVSFSAAAMGTNLDASAKQAEATNAAIHGLDESVKTVTDSIEAQTKTVTDLGTKQSKITKEISKALETQNSQQKDANTTLAEQKKIMQEQEAEIKKVTKAVDNQTAVLKKNASGWKMLMTGFAIKFASEIVDGFKSIISTGLEASRVYEDMSARLTPLVVIWKLPRKPSGALTASRMRRLPLRINLPMPLGHGTQSDDGLKIGTAKDKGRVKEKTI
jgi:prophage DNA circulation protein